MFKYRLVVFMGNPQKGDVIPLANWKHIVIKTAFKMTNIKTAGFLDKVSSIVKKTPPLKVILGRIEYFPTGEELTQYISIKNDRDIRRVHNAIKKEIEDDVETKNDNIEGSGYIPRIILDKNLDEKNGDRFEYNARVENFHYLYLIREKSRSKNTWQVLARIPFEG